MCACAACADAFLGMFICELCMVPHTPALPPPPIHKVCTHHACVEHGCELGGDGGPDVALQVDEAQQLWVLHVLARQVGYMHAR